MFASVAAGIHTSVEEAQRAMASGFSDEYQPNLERKKIYDSLYARYIELGKSY
jgi:L-ribulokinase